MLKEEARDEEASFEEEDSSISRLAKALAETCISGGLKKITRCHLEGASGLRGDACDLFALRVRYFIQRGWAYMAVIDCGGVRILNESERAAEAARRCRLGARKVVRADNALRATRVEALTPAQRAEHENAVAYVSRQSRALRASQRTK